MRKVRTSILALAVFWTFTAHAVPSQCDVCGATLTGQVFTYTDMVDQSRKWVCESCADLPTVCFQCGIPVLKDYLTLSDGRVLCSRDRVGVVLDDDEALAICRDVDRTLTSLLGRFTSFPATNLQIRLADRIDVRALVGVAGHDFSCPNLLGYTLSLQKSNAQWHEIRLLTGLQKGLLQATYAHELTHAWISENLPKARELQLRGDAAEGFCELVGYLVADAYRDEAAKAYVLGNQYTRGQVVLFIEAERQFGMLDVLDWMQYGRSIRLVPDRLADIRDVDMPASRPARPVSEILFIPKTLPKPRDSLELSSILIAPNRSVATINDRSFEVNEVRAVPLGGSNVVVRCVAIDAQSVLIERMESGIRERLSLSTPPDAENR